MKPSRRNSRNAQAKAEKRAGGRPPQSRYGAKVREAGAPPKRVQA